MEPIGTERPSGIGKQLANEPANRRKIRHLMTLRNIAQNHDIDIPLQQMTPVAFGESLSLRKTTASKVLAECFFQSRALPAR